MAAYLGIDTSNYTTSVAMYDSESCEIVQQKRLLPVKEGAIGQRQSDAVFGHVKALGDITEALMNGKTSPVALACSVSPRDEVGSYMPCFLSGKMAAKVTASVANIPLYETSHQVGHVVAAVYGAGCMQLLEKPFLAFHISGGTTQCLHVMPHDQKIVEIDTIAETMDLNAGQVIDRVGGMLGLSFPAGPALEKLAAQSNKSYKIKATFKDMNCCLSGVENQCATKLQLGESPEDIAKYCMSYIREVLITMTEKATEKHRDLPVVYAGGVMSNKFLQAAIAEHFKATQDQELYFAPPQYSADNAAGVAIIAWMHHERGGKQC